VRDANSMTLAAMCLPATPTVEQLLGWMNAGVGGVGVGCLGETMSVRRIACSCWAQVPLGHDVVVPRPAQCALESDGSSSAACVHHLWDAMGRTGGTGRRSLPDDTMKTGIEMRNTSPAAAIVLDFHARGLAHQPPAGDHTYLG